MKKTTMFSWVLVLTLLMLPMATAFSAGYNLAGVGAKALSMSGAFRGIADDWSAMYWNPAGLAGQDTKIHLEGKILLPKVTVTPVASRFYDNVEYTSESEVHPSGAFAYVHKINEKMNAGIAVFAPTAIGVTWKGLVVPPHDTYGNGDWPEEDWKGSIKVFDIHPTFAYMVNPKFRVGLGVSIFYSQIVLQYPNFIATGAPYPFDHVYSIAELDGSGLGFGANIGLLYDFTEQFHVGFNFFTGSTLPVSGKVNQTAFMPNTGAAPYLGQTMTGEPDADADFPLPMEAGIGFAYDYNERLTFGLDVQWTNWAVTETVKIEMDGTGATGLPAEDAELVLDYEDVIRFNLGVNYVVDPEKGFEVRAGYYFDPTAIPDETLRPSITDVNDKHSISIGCAYQVMPKLLLEAYWEHLFSNTRKLTDTYEDNLPGFWKMGVETIGIQFTYFLGANGE